MSVVPNQCPVDVLYVLVLYYPSTQLTWQLNLNTVSLRHKHGPETLIIHVNQCIHIVLAFSSNARQSNLHLKYCFQQKFILENFNFFFRNFYLIASLKLNEVSLRNKHSLEILFTHRKFFFTYYVNAFIVNAI